MTRVVVVAFDSTGDEVSRQVVGASATSATIDSLEAGDYKIVVLPLDIVRMDGDALSAIGEVDLAAFIASHRRPHHRR